MKSKPIKGKSLRSLSKKNRPRASLAKIRGLIIPADWDDEGNVKGIAISTRKEEEFRIDMSHKGKELMAYLQREAEVHGFLREEKNKIFLKVEHFQIKEPEFSGVILDSLS